jgi:hypothetical protein
VTHAGAACEANGAVGCLASGSQLDAPPSEGGGEPACGGWLSGSRWPTVDPTAAGRGPSHGALHPIRSAFNTGQALAGRHAARLESSYLRSQHCLRSVVFWASSST